MVTSHELAKALYSAITQHPKKIDHVVEVFLNFVEEKKLTTLLPHVARHIERMQAVAEKAKAVQVTVARKQDKNVIQSIIDYIDIASDTPVSVIEDETIEGGFIALHANKVYDASVRTAKEKIRTTLLT